MNKQRFGRDSKLGRKEEAVEKKHAGDSLVERPSAGRRRHGRGCQGAAAAAAELAGRVALESPRARETMPFRNVKSLESCRSIKLHMMLLRGIYSCLFEDVTR